MGIIKDGWRRKAPALFRHGTRKLRREDLEEALIRTPPCIASDLAVLDRYRDELLNLDMSVGALQYYGELLEPDDPHVFEFVRAIIIRGCAKEIDESRFRPGVSLTPILKVLREPDRGWLLSSVENWSRCVHRHAVDELEPFRLDRSVGPFGEILQRLDAVAA